MKRERLIRLGQMLVELGQEDRIDDMAILKRLQENRAVRGRSGDMFREVWNATGIKKMIFHKYFVYLGAESW